MRAQSDVCLNDFAVDVAFFSDGEHFASQTYAVTVRSDS